MIISTEWLADYVQLSVPPETIAERLAMAGLNHESSSRVGNDTAIELEITSNRPDCLGHIGVAREAAALFTRPLLLPNPQPLQSGARASESVVVEIASPAMCPYYQARVIRGVRVGKSPAWLVDRLATLGIASVNNVVDVTNYVMMECGQPLHAFDLAKVRGGRIIVRAAKSGEPFEAINHKRYELTDRMCVIADAVGPVALAGVMGGAESEIGDATCDVLLESAQFAPLAVRAAARGLALASDSSYRFERGPDPSAVDWAGRRAAQMILELAGGRLEHGVSEAGSLTGTRARIDFGDDAVAEVLGVDIPVDRQHSILASLGFERNVHDGAQASWTAPSWRRDVTRPIDLVEEIARIEGYDHVPEDVPIHSRPVEASRRDTAVARVAEVMVSAGLCEAMTRSVVGESLESLGSPWSVRPPLAIEPALVRGADRLRRSLIPSLLEARGINASVGSPHGDLFEVARLYLPRTDSPSSPCPAGSLPDEPLAIAFVTAGDYANAKGLVEAVLARLALDGTGYGASGATAVRYTPADVPLFETGRAAEIILPSHDGRPRVGVVGEVSRAVLDALGITGPVSAAELLVDRLDFAVETDRAIVRPADFQAVDRDVNLVVEESVSWSEVASAIADAAGATLEHLRLDQVWVDAAKLGEGRKSLLVSLRLRSPSGTLSGDDTRRILDAVVASCGERCRATLR